MQRLPEILFFFAATVAVASPGRGADLYVGVAEADITHAQPMALWGQMHTRISKSVETPVTAQVVAFESRPADRPLDSAIMISGDVIGLPHEVLVALPKRVAERLPDFDVQKLFVSGTHTHTGPAFKEGDDEIPQEEAVQPAEYVRFFVERVSEAAAQAWQARQRDAAAWGLAPGACRRRTEPPRGLRRRPGGKVRSHRRAGQVAVAGAEALTWTFLREMASA